MEKTEKILARIEEEICSLLIKQPLNMDDIEVLSKLADAAKDIATVEGMSEYYNDGMSYAPRMPKVSYNSPMHKKYYGGYSGHSANDKMIAALERALEDATTEYETQQILDEIQYLRTR